MCPPGRCAHGQLDKLQTVDDPYTLVRRKRAGGSRLAVSEDGNRNRDLDRGQSRSILHKLLDGHGAYVILRTQQNFYLASCRHLSAKMVETLRVSYYHAESLPF